MKKESMCWTHFVAAVNAKKYVKRTARTTCVILGIPVTDYINYIQKPNEHYQQCLKVAKMREGRMNHI